MKYFVLFTSFILIISTAMVEIACKKEGKIISKNQKAVEIVQGKKNCSQRDGFSEVRTSNKSVSEMINCDTYEFHTVILFL